jgi:hypothetical protein
MTANIAESKPKQTPLPDVGDIIFFLMMYIMLFLRPSFVFGDGSTGWHIFTGKMILESANHAIPTTDFMTYGIHAGKPWVAYEWLSDLVMAALVQLGGMNLLAVFVSGAIALLFLLLYERCRQEGCHFVTALVITVLGALTSSIHWLARPHLFTFFGVYIFATVLEDRYRDRIKGVRFFLPLALFMLIWANAHPGFIVGFAMIGLYLVCSIINFAIFSDSQACALSSAKIRDNAIALAITGVATLANPYGIKLYSYLSHYLKTSQAILAATQEYLSPNFHSDFAPVCLALLFGIFAFSLTASLKRLSMPRFLLCLVFAFLALTAVRHMPLFVIVVLPAIAQLFSSVKPITTINLGESAPEPVPAIWWQNLVAKLKEVGQGFAENEAICQMHLVPILTVLVFSLASIFGNGNFLLGSLASDFDTDGLPGQKMLTYITEKERSGELKPEAGLNYDNWGGFLRLRLYDKEHPLNSRVFIDDRADFYGDKYYQDYALVSQGLPGYQNVLDKNKINWIIFPANSRLGAILKGTPDWTLAQKDAASYLLVRKTAL